VFTAVGQSCNMQLDNVECGFGSIVQPGMMKEFRVHMIKKKRRNIHHILCTHSLTCSLCVCIGIYIYIYVLLFKYS
jgi:hypothetical protein